MRKILILTEAGENVGYGHLSRCHAICDNLLSKGFICDLLYNSKSQINSFYGKNFNWLEFYEDSVVNKVEHSDIVLIDSYLVPYKRLLDVSKKSKLVVLDDFNRIKYPKDTIIINPNVLSSILDYSNQHSLVFSGSDFIIIRDSIRLSKGCFTLNKNVKNITLTIGGSDYKNIFQRLINSINNERYNLNVIAASESKKRELDCIYVNESSVKIIGFLNEKELLKMYLGSDIVVSACGQTAFELACLGIPSVCFCVDKDQENNMEVLYNLDIIGRKINIKEYGFEKKIADEIENLKSYNMRKRISDKGKKKIKGIGADKISNIIYNL